MNKHKILGLGFLVMVSMSPYYIAQAQFLITWYVI